MKRSAIILAGVLFTSTGVAFGQDINDAQIASIVVTANQVDIDAGRLAATKAADPEVKKFAQLMVTDHTGVNKSAVDLATKLKVTPEDNPTSRTIKAGGDENIANLKTLKGAAFDKAYVDHEVTYHQQVLDALDKTLIPGARNEELKALLVKVRPAFEAHLAHAKQVQSSLGKTISMDGTRFEPSSLTVRRGDAIVWVNGDPFPHTATSSAAGFDSHAIAPGASWRYVAATRGAFTYACSFHPTMTGTILVE
jgi:putative membrane protein